MRLDGDPDDCLAYSGDGGDTWIDALAFKGNMLGFALSPDGATVAVGRRHGWHLDRAHRHPGLHRRGLHRRRQALTWTSEGLYACGNEFVDGFTLGLLPLRPGRPSLR